MPNKNEDRPSDSFPTSAFNRFNYGAPTMKREAPVNFQKAVTKSSNAPEELKDAVLARKMKYCGGSSKPYKK